MARIALSCQRLTWDCFNSALTNDYANCAEIAERQHARYLFGYLTQLNAGSMLIEYPYTDADYLDDFTSYYARCFTPFRAECRRLHFFDGEFAAESQEKIISGTLSLAELEQLRSSYLGFVVARPLPQAVIGRTVLRTFDSDAGRRRYPSTRTYKVNLAGIDFTVDSLAFQEQDTVLAACATVSLWSCFQKTSTLFGTTAPTPSIITKATQAIHYGRSFPSQGLTITEMCAAIRHIGLEPEVIDLKNPGVPLLSLVYGYMQLGVPLVLCLDVPDGRHAIALVGYSLRSSQIHQQEVSVSSPDVLLPLTGLRIDKLYGHDDQVGPFCKLEVQAPTPAEPRLQFVREGEIATPHAVVIPVYNKVRLTFLDVQSWLSRIHTVMAVFLPEGSAHYWDIALCLSNEYKGWARTNSVFRHEARTEILMTAYPRFIWRGTLRLNEIDVLHVIFDATGIARSLPVYQVIWLNTDLLKAVAGLFSVSTLQQHLKHLLTPRLFEFLRNSLNQAEPQVQQPKTES